MEDLGINRFPKKGRPRTRELKVPKLKEQKEPKEKKGKGTITPKNSPKNSPRKLCITVSPKDCGGNNEGNNEDMIDIKEEFNNITMANTHSTQSQCDNFLD